MAEPSHPLTDAELHRLRTTIADRMALAVFLELETDVAFLALLTRGLAELKARAARGVVDMKSNAWVVIVDDEHGALVMSVPGQWQRLPEDGNVKALVPRLIPNEGDAWRLSRTVATLPGQSVPRALKASTVGL